MTTSTSNPSRKTSLGSKSADLGTRELSQRHIVAPDIQARGRRARVVDESAYDKMLLSDRITFDQHQYFEGLSKRLHAAGFIGLGASRFDRIRQGQVVTEQRAAMVNSELADIVLALDAAIGVRGRAAIIAMLVDDVPLPKWMDKKSIDKATEVIGRVLG